MISIKLRDILENAGQICKTLDHLYDKKLRGKEGTFVVGTKNPIPLDDAIVYYENKFSTVLLNLKEILSYGT